LRAGAGLGRGGGDWAGGIFPAVSGDGRGAVWPREPLGDGEFRAARRGFEAAGAVSSGGQRASRGGDSDGGAFGAAGGGAGVWGFGAAGGVKW